jgi:hypothetical protein
MHTHFGFFGRDTMDSETSLDIVDQTVEFAGLFDGDDVCKIITSCNRAKRINACGLLTHETSWVVGVGADFAVNFDVTLHNDFGHFALVQRIL